MSDEDAGRLADIIGVADCYSIPLDFFLGIGAMENNYLNVDGDLEHAIWNRRAQKGDAVLKRRQRRVLVLNQASGVWQITRETLRYAHRLFVEDQRGLQPPSAATAAIERSGPGPHRSRGPHHLRDFCSATCSTASTET